MSGPRWLLVVGKWVWKALSRLMLSRRCPSCRPAHGLGVRKSLPNLRLRVSSRPWPVGVGVRVGVSREKGGCKGQLPAVLPPRWQGSL